MIHHVSIEVDGPKQAATVLASLMGGSVREGFPVKGACTAFADDKFGTLVECWPRRPANAIAEAGTAILDIRDGVAPQDRLSFHVAISVDLDDDAILAIAREAGWDASVRHGGPFSVVEVWVENRVMFEVLSPAQAQNYLRAVT